MRISSYPSIFNLGHPAIAEIFSDSVEVTEKVDGSQISFAMLDGVLQVRSKNAVIEGDPGMFKAALDTIHELEPLLHPNWTYRGEYLAKPKHNCIAYLRVPVKHIVLFDVMVGYEDYVTHDVMASEASRLGLESVPIVYRGMVENVKQFEDFFNLDSFLGGAKIEGVVFKNYQRFGKDKKPLFAKYVRPEFKELNRESWSAANPKNKDVIGNLIEGLRTEARWQKAVQHLADANALEHSPRDIGKLLIEIQNDVEKECKEEILEALWKNAWPQIKRGVIAGFPEHYKKALAESQFQK